MKKKPMMKKINKKVIKTFTFTETITEVVGVAFGSVGIAALAGVATAPIGLVL